MIFKFKVLSDENDKFRRDIEIDSYANFLDLNNAILDAVGFTKDQPTSFFICEDDWEMGQEITLVEMDTSADRDSYIMEKTKIEEFADEKGQKLMLVFDYLNERAFYIELDDIILGKSLDAPVCTKKVGKAPTQTNTDILNDDFSDLTKGGKNKKGNDIDLEELGFGDDNDFDEEEIQDFTDTEELEDFH